MPTFTRLLERFEAAWLPARDCSVRSLEDLGYKIARYKTDLGTKMVGQLDVLEVAEYLDQFNNNAYTKHHGLMVQIFAFAVAKELAECNVAALTLIKVETEKTRQRHSQEGLDAILAYDCASDCLRRAIRLALVSLQRREDIVTWRKDAVNLEHNTIRVSPGKTQNHANPIHLEIMMAAPCAMWSKSAWHRRQSAQS